MKKFTFNTPKHRLFIKGLTALSLSLALQGRSCRFGRGEKTLSEQNSNLVEKLENTVDISRTYGEKPNVLYDAVSAKDAKSVATVLARIDQDINEGKNKDYKDQEFPNTYDPKTKQTALGLAIKEGYTEVVQLLAESKHIDINKAKEGSTALLEALWHNKKEIASILVRDDRTNVNAINEKTQQTALGLAIEKGYTDIVKELIKRDDIDINKAKEGSTSLLEAFLHNRKEIATMLVGSKGINIDGKDPKLGGSLLHMAIKQKFEDVAYNLMTKLSEEDLIVQNKNNATPLHLAIENKLKGIVHVLTTKLSTIEHLCIKDNKKRTPLHMAVRKNNRDAFNLISDYIMHKLAIDPSIFIAKLFEKDSKGRSVFACSYLPKSALAAKVHIFEKNLGMFKDVLRSVRTKLDAKDWEAIVTEINSLEQQRTIKQSYAIKLRKIVDETRPPKL